MFVIGNHAQDPLADRGERGRADRPNSGPSAYLSAWTLAGASSPVTHARDVRVADNRDIARACGAMALRRYDGTLYPGRPRRERAIQGRQSCLRSRTHQP